ncbi:type IV secretory system conjugative DNA transfer family protein [Cognatishimia activa]|uniref:ATP-binding protein n=1 Tax=Cognatishimia activa TaxID=1715691 RepID=A0A975I8V0_9RHOB|nr:type IV secretory system conjugative DNA transfer family protein [Cognatishimia activa]QTN36251.1 ATP-binding protein [Cognatishimia activa]
MVFDLGPRIHAMLSGMGQSKEGRELRTLYEEVAALFEQHGVADEAGRIAVAKRIITEVAERMAVQDDADRVQSIFHFVMGLIKFENLFELPFVEEKPKLPTAKVWEIKTLLERQKVLASNFDLVLERLTDLATACFNRLWASVPESSTDDGLRVQSELIHNISDLGGLVHELAGFVFHDDFKELGIFEDLTSTLEVKLILASGGNPHDPSAFNRAPKYANKTDIKDANELVQTYVGGTPLADLFSGKLNFTIPTKTRFEHHHILAGSGHGKTQTLQYLIANDLRSVMRGERSIIILDSQGDLIRNISNLAVFAEGGELHDRIVIIDPTDVEYPVSLNLFDVGQDRLSGYAPLERERLTNSILELYDFVLGTLLDAQMTQKQSVIFRYVTRLMLHIPNATIHTLRELMEPDAHIKFADDIAKLTGSAKHFFETEFTSREFEQTKRQVLRRLWGILENQTFERMFSHPQSKLDLFHEMNAGKVILINTAKDLLKESGTEIFGRFFIALIAQAAQERAVLPNNARTPTFVYIDEAADYLDANVSTILSQARKYNVGMVLAHQYMGQLSPALADSFAANTSIKFAGGVSAKDARTMAAQMYCEPSLIERQGKGSFASHIRGVTKQAVPLQFPFGLMEKLPQMTATERQVLQKRMRANHAVHYSELAQGGETKGTEDVDDQDPDEPTPYW